MTISSINCNSIMARQIYSPIQERFSAQKNNLNAARPYFAGRMDEVALSAEKSKSKYEIILGNRIKKGLNPEMAKELLKAVSPIIDIILENDYAGNNIFPNELLNDLYKRGFSYTNNIYGFPTLKNGDIVIFEKNNIRGEFSFDANETKSGIYALTINSQNLFKNSSQLDSKESYKVYVPQSDIERSEYYYQKKEEIPFRYGYSSKNGLLIDIQ